MSFKYKESNLSYLIKISKIEEDKKINIQIINESNLSERYIKDFSLDYFQNLSDLFKNKTISEIENIIKQLIENNKYKLKQNINYINIEFNIEIQFINSITISIEIPKESLFTENQLKSIITPITDTINNNITYLIEKMARLEAKNEEIIKKLNKLEEEKIKLKNKITNSLFNENPSKIVTGEEEINFVKKIFKNKKFNLLYRATIDGDAFTTFHSKCDDKGTTLSLFKTDKNRKWGAYSEYPWNSSNGCDPYKNNSNSKYFLINISDKKKYLPKKNHTRFNGGHSNVWFCDTMGISSNSILSIDGGTENKGINSLYENYVKEYEITGGNKFTCVELEVYQVETIS